MAAPTTASGYTAQDAANLVIEGFNSSWGLADTWLLKAEAAINALDQVHIDPLTLDVTYDVDAFLPTFRRPTKPADPVIDPVGADTPDAPELQPIVVTPLGDAPAEPDMDQLLAYAPPNAPTDPVPTAPSNLTPVRINVVVEDRPAYVLPTLGELRAIEIPTFEPVEIPEFDVPPPTFSFDVPEDGALNFVEQAYDPAFLNDVKAKLSTMLQGQHGLPWAIEQMIFDRGRAREDRLSRKQVMEVTEDMGARGLAEPNGILARRLREVHADNREKAAALNRDLTIEVEQQALEGVKFAVTNGIAMEQALIQQNLAINDRALRVAIYARDYALNRLNAIISAANLEQQVYATRASVWKTLIEGRIAALEQVRIQIAAQQLVSESNRDVLAKFQAEYDGLKALADFYRTDIEAAKTKNEINQQNIEEVRLRLQAYSTQVDAWGKRWDGFKNQVEAQLGTARFAEVASNVYATRMQGYKIRGDAYFQDGQLQIARNAADIDRFRALLARQANELQAQIAHSDNQIKAFDAKTRLYAADAEIAQAESAAYDRTTSLKIENERNRTAVAVQVMQARMEQMLRGAEILVEQIKAKAAAISQLLASSQSGVNLSASIAGSGSTSASHSLSWAYGGEASDYNGTPPFFRF